MRGAQRAYSLWPAVTVVGGFAGIIGGIAWGGLLAVGVLYLLPYQPTPSADPEASGGFLIATQIPMTVIISLLAYGIGTSIVPAKLRKARYLKTDLRLVLMFTWIFYLIMNRSAS